MVNRGKKSVEGGGDANLGGVLRTLGGFVDLLSKLGENGELKQEGEVESGGDKNVKAVYGFSVRLGGNGAPRVEPFGNLKVGKKGTVVEETREPLVDVFDEEDHVLVLAELPGVDEKGIRYELHEETLMLSAGHKDRKYKKELELPAAVDKTLATSSYHNGVFELKLPKKR